MDKELVNTQIVLMRKIVRNVKRFVYQKLLKQMKVLQIKQNKNQNKEIVKKLNHKIENKRQELMAIKGVNVDNVSKQALLNDRTHFENLIKSSKPNFDERAIARIAIHENVVKAVNKFKEENPNCELWLPSQIELWQQKKLMKRNKILQKKNSSKENNSKDQEIDRTDNELIVNNNNDIENENNSKLESKSRKTKEKVNKRNKKVVVKRIDLKSSDSQIISFDEDIDNEAENDESLETDKNDDKNIQSKVDPFFLSDNLEINDQKSDEDIEEEVAFNRNKKLGRSKDLGRSKRQESKFSKTNDRIKSKSTNYQKFQNNDFDKRQNKSPNKLKTSKTTKESEVNKSEKSGSKSEKMHPSWAAKRLMNQKLKISFDQKPIAKKIKFDD